MSYWFENFLAGISFNGIINLGAVCAAFAGAVAAFLGISTWRAEMIGRRRAQLAEETLARFYEARDHLAWVRNPIGFQGEGETRIRVPGETEQERAERDSYYRTVERITKKAEFWGAFDASRYRFRAIFGASAAEPFDIIRARRHSVAVAAGALIRHDRRHRLVEDHPSHDHNEALLEQWENTIGWGTAEADKIAAAIDQAVAAMEATCQPAIDGFHRRRKSTQ